MYTVSAEEHFDSAHFLKGYDGKCSNLHGHRWKVVVEVSGEELQDGMLMDFTDLKAELKKLADHYDHCLIIEKGSLKEKTMEALREENFRIVELDCRPTAENLAREFFTHFRKINCPVTACRVYETPTNVAEYRE